MSDEQSLGHRAALLAGDLVIGCARRVYHAMPPRLQREVETRFFGAVFQVTRVTNDAYGWRPDTPPGGEPPPGVKIGEQKA